MAGVAIVLPRASQMGRRVLSFLSLTRPYADLRRGRAELRSGVVSETYSSLTAYMDRAEVLTAAAAACAASFLECGGGALPESVDAGTAARAFAAAVAAAPPPPADAAAADRRLTFRDAFAWAAAFTNTLQAHAGAAAQSCDDTAPAARAFLTTARVRVATVADAPIIMGFVRELADFEHAAPSDVTTDEAVIAADGWGAEPAFHCFVAEVPAAVAAAAGCASTPSTVDGWTPAAIALAHPIYSTWMGRSLCACVRSARRLPANSAMGGARRA